MCWTKLKFSKNGYTVREFCGKCDKCNGIFGHCGCIPCPMRFSKPDQQKQSDVESPEDTSCRKYLVTDRKDDQNV